MNQRFKETDILYMSGCKNRRLKLKIHVGADWQVHSEKRGYVSIWKEERTVGYTFYFSPH